MIRGFDDQEPTVAESAYVDPAATVIGNVTIHADAPGERVLLEEHAAVGHNAIVHNATVGEHSLVGMATTVLDGATVELLREGLDRDSDLFGTAARYTECVKALRTGPSAGDSRADG